MNLGSGEESEGKGNDFGFGCVEFKVISMSSEYLCFSPVETISRTVCHLTVSCLTYSIHTLRNREPFGSFYLIEHNLCLPYLPGVGEMGTVMMWLKWPSLWQYMTYPSLHS